jgi:hypothetical protein
VYSLQGKNDNERRLSVNTKRGNVMNIPRSPERNGPGRVNRPESSTAAQRRRLALALAAGFALSVAGGTGTAYAKGGTAKPPKTPTPAPVTVVVPPPPPVPAPVFSAAATDIHGFDIVGFIQDATVSDGTCKGLPAAQWGGTAVINGITITIPCNAIVQFPAATFTWADSFATTATSSTGTIFPVPNLPLRSAMGGSSTFKYPSTEIHVVGNIVGGQHIAGLVFFSQQSANQGQGYITGFDYANGVIFVGNKTTGSYEVRLQINDPAGRFSKGQSPDPRFSVDDQNPTIKSSSGYPMCVPRTDPTKVKPNTQVLDDDPLCPQRNRPKVKASAALPTGCRNFAAAGIVSPAGWEMAPSIVGQVYCSGFVMGDPTKATATDPDSQQQAPFEIGDFITYAGTLVRDGQGPNGSDTVSVHTIEANVGIFTQPGTLPVYIAIGEFGVGPDAPATFPAPPAPGGVPQEAADRMFLEASVTDVTSVVDIYLVDIDPVTGAQSHRWITPDAMTAGITPGTPPYGGGITTQFIGPQPGRARIRANKAPVGILASPTRYVRVVTRSLCTPDQFNPTNSAFPPPAPGADCLNSRIAANGLSTGQYLAPTFEFIFPENVVAGDTIVPGNLWDLGFLVNGEGPGTGPLMPKPW